MTSTVGSQWNYNYCANGIYDPNISGTGISPYGASRLWAIYDHAYVIASKITVRLMNNTGNSNMHAVSLYLNDDATNTPAGNLTAMQNSSRFVTLPAASNNAYTLSCNFNSKKIFGSGLMSNVNLRNTASSNPTETSVFSLAGYCPNVQTGVLDLEVFIEYVVIFNELRDLNS